MNQVGFMSTLLSLLIVANSVSGCQYTVGDNILDLDVLGSTQILTGYKQWTFILTACSNSLNCNGVTAMAIQDNSGTCTAYIAEYEEDITPTYSSSNGGTWYFAYANGDDSGNCDINRKLNLYFICTSSVCIIYHIHF